MKVEWMNHTGFVVKDLERSVEFYSAVVGLQVVARREREDGPISQIVGYEDSHIKLALLGIDQDRGHILELIEYLNPVSAERPTQERAVLGASHLAFNVTDISGKLKTLQTLGVDLIDQTPREGLSGTIAFVHPRSVFGILTELVESVPNND